MQYLFIKIFSSLTIIESFLSPFNTSNHNSHLFPIHFKCNLACSTFKKELYHILSLTAILFFQQNKKIYNHFAILPNLTTTQLFSYNSNIIVNGPSFSNSTFISAPNSPVSTTDTCFLHSWIMYSYNSFANSGFPAFVNDGRLPWLQSA